MVSPSSRSSIIDGEFAMAVLFTDRAEAGRMLAERVLALHLPGPLVVLALPRGGVPIAVQVARALGAPVDLLLVRKIGLPWQPELALAAVVDGEPPELVIDEEVQRSADLEAGYIESEAIKEIREIARRRALYLRGRSSIALEGKTVVVVDDGIATGTTMRAALKALRRRKLAGLVLAVPVAPRETVDALRATVDHIVCLAEPDPFYAIGAHYRDFHQVSDDEVLAALDLAAGSNTVPV
jgi:putative phosphoribosyl transferase